MRKSHVELTGRNHLAFFQEFFSGGGKIYCYVNFFVMLISLLFSDQISGGKVSEGANCLRGAPPAPCGRKPDTDFKIIWYKRPRSIAVFSFLEMQ